MNLTLKVLLSASVIVLCFGSLPVVPEVLQGGVEHSESMPSVEPQFQAGVMFNESSIQSIPAEEGWYWVPAWIVGTWQRETETKYTWLGKYTHMSQTTKRCGMQRDRNGEYWDYYHVPYVQPVDGGPYIEYKIIRGYTILPASPGNFNMRYLSTCIRVNKQTGMIMSSHTQEDLNRYSSAGPGMLRNDGSLRMFNASGRASKPVRGFYIANMVKPYEPIDSLDSKDMRLSFRNYLLSHGLADLLPYDLRN